MSREVKKYDGGVIEGQLSDAEFLTECLDVDGFDAMKEVKRLADEGDTDGAVSGLANFFREYANPHLFDDVIPVPVGVNFARGESISDAVGRIMNHDMISCGVRCKFDPETVDWLYNPTPDGYREFTWQFQRHHEFKILAYFYRTTGQEKYAECFRELILSWITQSAPLPMDVGGGYTDFWRTIECGIRMWDSWPCAIFSFARSASLSDRDIVNILKCVYEHGLRLAKHYTVSNWLIMEMNGLIHISLLFPFLKRSKEWEGFASKMLADQIKEQIYPDGFQQELTTNYHQVVITNYEGVLNVYGKVGKIPPRELVSALELMYDVYPKLVMPNFVTPNLNDGADLGMPAALAAAVRILPERKDLLFLQSEGKLGNEPNFNSACFPFSGYAVMRSDWSREAFWCLFEDAPLGFGHQHEDKLEILMYAYGKYMLPEAGRHAYDASPLHAYSLSTAAHNTVLVDRRGQCRRDRFKWDPDSLKKSAGLDFKAEHNYECAQGEYCEKYGKELIDVIHRRRVIWIKNRARPLVVVIDRMQSRDRNRHEYTAVWHFDNQDINVRSDSAVLSYPDSAGLKMIHNLDASLLVKAQNDPVQGYLCNEAPGAESPLPTVLCSERGNDIRFVTVFEPSPDGIYSICSVYASKDIDRNDIKISFVDGERLEIDERDYFNFR